MRKKIHTCVMDQPENMASDDDIGLTMDVIEEVTVYRVSACYMDAKT